MLPTEADYRKYGRTIGARHRENYGPIRDWEGFREVKSNMLGIFANMRSLCGFDDVFGVGTYRGYDSDQMWAYEAMKDGFREEATE